MGGASASNKVQKGQVFTCLRGSDFGSAPFLFPGPGDTCPFYYGSFHHGPQAVRLHL